MLITWFDDTSSYICLVSWEKDSYLRSDNEGPDQTVHVRSLIGAFVVRLV